MTVLFLTLGPSAATLAAPGALAQLSGSDGCVKETPVAGDCAGGRALDGARAVAVSPDGRHVYVAAFAGAVAVFSRNKTTGVLTQPAGPEGCVKDTPVAGDCVDGKALSGAFSLVVSPDGKHVYVASLYANAVAAFSRNKTTGALTPLAGTGGCVSEDGTGGECVQGKALAGAISLALSRDGKHLYVASASSSAVAVFSRNKTTGVLTQLAGTSGCVSDDGTGGACVHGRVLLNARSVAVSPDGKHVYATSHGSEAVVGFSRNHATGALTQLSGTAGCVKETPVAGDCTAGRALHGPSALTVSPDGKHVYVASSFGQSVAVLSRNKTTGAVTQLVGTDGCVSEDGTGGDCADGKALSGATSVAVSPDGKHVYVASNFIDAVAVFSRNKATGVLTQLAGTAGCVSEDGTGGSCVDGKALGGPFGVTVSNDGKQVYAVSASSSAVAIFSRQK